MSKKNYKKLFLKSKQPLNSRAFKEIQKIRYPRPQWEEWTMFVFKILSIRHHNKSYDYEDNDKYRQKPTKIQPNFPEESVEAN